MTVEFSWVPHWASPTHQALGAMVEVDAKCYLRLLLKTTHGLEVVEAPARGVLVLEVRLLGPRAQPLSAEFTVHWSPGDEQLPACLYRTQYGLPEGEPTVDAALAGAVRAVGYSEATAAFWSRPLMVELEKKLSAGVVVKPASAGGGGPHNDATLLGSDARHLLGQEEVQAGPEGLPRELL
jgi:hypothetical protein